MSLLSLEQSRYRNLILSQVCFKLNFQSPGFALIIDRRKESWQEVQKVFSRVIPIFPGKIKEVFLLYKYPDGTYIFMTWHYSLYILGYLGKPVLGQLVEDYLMDFDIFHVSQVTELLHYVEAKYLPFNLGGSNPADVDTWLVVQENVDSFTVSATKCARRMATFVKILNKEDISTLEDREAVREVNVREMRARLNC